MSDMRGMKLTRSARHLWRLLVTAACIMLFTLLMIQDVKLFIQNATHQSHMALRKHLSRDYAVIQGNSLLYFNESVSIDVITPNRYRISRRTMPVIPDTPSKSQQALSNTVQRVDTDRFRVSNSRTLKELVPTDSSKSKSYCGQKARKTLMNRACEWLKENNSNFTNVAKFKQTFSYSMIFVDDKRKLLYCEVPKVACTSWKVFFANLSGKVDPKDYKRLHELVHDTTYYPKVGFKYLREYSPEERQYRLQHYFKFLVTRNPYSRIISAFENKLFADTPQSKWYHDNVGKYIIKKYRANPSQASLAKGNDARFEELVKFVGDPKENIRYRYDAHWWNMHSGCYPCLFSYDYIAKLETIDQDIEELMDHIAPGENLTLPYLNANKGSKSNLDKIRAYFRDVSETDRSRLEKIYEADLKSFGYSMTDNSLECQYSDLP